MRMPFGKLFLHFPPATCCSMTFGSVTFDWGSDS